MLSQLAPRRVLTLPAHYPQVLLPPIAQPAPPPSMTASAPVAALKETDVMSFDYQLMQPPPPLPPVLAMPANGSAHVLQPVPVQVAPTPVTPIAPVAPTPAMPVIAPAPATPLAPAAIAPLVAAEPPRNPMATQLLNFDRQQPRVGASLPNKRGRWGCWRRCTTRRTPHRPWNYSGCRRQRNLRLRPRRNYSGWRGRRLYAERLRRHNRPRQPPLSHTSRDAHAFTIHN